MGGHSRLEKLLDKNRITKNGFLTGKEEADAFDNKNYVALHQSTLRKADVLANVAERANDGTLKTNAGWWDVHGGGLRQIVDGAKEHPLFIIGSGLVTVATTVVGLISDWPILAPVKAAVLAWLNSFT